MAARSIALITIAAALSAAAAVAADPPAQDQKQRICRGATKSLGSRIRRPQRCRTAEQWQAEDEEKARMPISLQVTQGQNDDCQSPTPQ